MQTLRRLAPAALVLAALLLTAAITHAEAASVDVACRYVDSISLDDGVHFASCPPPLSGEDTSCRVADGVFYHPVVSASADGNQSYYTYDVICDQDGAHVRAKYDLSTGEADEEIDYGDTVSAVWTCAHDPWSAPSPQSCTLTDGTIAFPAPGGNEDIDLSQSQKDGVPFSARMLDDDARLVLLQAQLQYAVNQPAAQAAAQHSAFLATQVTPVSPSGAITAAQQAGQEAAQHSALLATQVTPVGNSANCAACSASVTAAASPSPSPQPSASPSPAAYHAPSIVAGWPQLATFTQGEAVTSLQYLLLQSAPTLSVDGKFGSSTDAAVRAFQKAQGITADGVGIVGPQTWQALLVTVQQGSHGAAVKAVQSQLKSRGMAITVDGDFGSQTDTAVRAYQQAHGLAIDGQVGPQTWQSLLVGN